MTTPRLGAPELVVAQDVPETTVNEQIRFVEQGASRFLVVDKDLATPPGSPSDGAAYIVAGSATGDWTGWATRIAFYAAGWESIIPQEGMRAYVQDENAEYEFDGSAWSVVAGLGFPALDDLTDVDLTGASTGDVLTKDAGGDWVASAPAGGGASTTQDDEMIAGFIGTPADKSYTIALKMAHGGTITETTTQSASGACTATFKVNSTALGGTANSVSTSEQSQAHASTNTFVAGDNIVLTVSSNSSCADMSFSIKYTRTLD